MLLALYASIVLILIAGDALLFLLAWEVMSILCYLLVVSSPDREERPTRLGVSAARDGRGRNARGRTRLPACSALGASSLEFDALKSGASALGANARWGVFLLTFFGFGVKAGLVPVNSWLQPAYAAAPRAFAPVLAGRNAEPRSVWHPACQRRSHAGRAGGDGPGRTRRRDRFCAARDSLRDHRQRSQGDAGAQLHRKCRHRRRRLRRGNGVRRYESSAARGASPSSRRSTT